jgi:tetratricopeptide (TPR) repeat protein
VALVVIDEIIRLNNERLDVDEKYRKILQLAEAATLRGDYAERQRLFDDADALGMRLGTNIPGINKRTRNFELFLLQGECYQGLKEWYRAMDLYIDMLSTLTKPEDATSEQSYRTFIGLARCSYEVGDYERCIYASSLALSMDPHEPGSHKYKALSEKALGNIDRAIETMIEACLYEIPWDDKNKQVQLDMYDQLVAEASKRNVSG